MIEAKHVQFAYRGLEPVLRDLSMEESAGHCLALLGNNGAGKSTCLKCLNRILEPKVLLLDEPTANLDLHNQHEVMRMVSGVAKENGILAVVVIHDLNLALKYCDRFLFIRDGADYRYGDSSVVTEEVIRRVYGVDASIVEIDGGKTVVVR